MSATPLHTPLHPRHLGLAATMAPFAGWDMPLWYKAGAVKEHLAVVQAAGLFDTSHMDVLLIEGGSGRDFLNAAFTRDLTDLRPERCAYGAFLDKNGNCLDDAIVYPLGEDRHAVVLNASMGQVILQHLAGLPGADRVRIALPAERPAKLDVQGPTATRIVAGLLRDAAAAFEGLPYFSFKGDFDFARSRVRLADGTPILLSRTGYTGESGFEIFLPAEAAGEVWDAILRTGGDFGTLPCGLAARDSLRTGAVLPLSHQDIGPWPFVNHPWSFALPFAEDGSFSKDFVGASALDPATAQHTLPFAGFDQRRVDSHEAAVLLDGKAIGTVTTIVSDMAIGRVDGRILGVASPDRPEGWTPRGLACGFVRVDRRLEPGAEIVLKDKRREIKAAVVQDIRPDRTARKKLVF